MREIKFRQAIFHPVTGEFLKWHYWGLIDGAFVGIDTGWVSPTKAIEDSLMFTNLPDKNGKETYHKDICQDEFGNRWVIDWSDAYAGFELTLLYSPHKEFPVLNICTVIGMEVIGNIYENKELIAKEDNSG